MLFLLGDGVVGSHLCFATSSLLPVFPGKPATGHELIIRMLGDAPEVHIGCARDTPRWLGAGRRGNDLGLPPVFRTESRCRCFGAFRSGFGVSAQLADPCHRVHARYRIKRYTRCTGA